MPRIFYKNKFEENTRSTCQLDKASCTINLITQKSDIQVTKNASQIKFKQSKKKRNLQSQTTNPKWLLFFFLMYLEHPSSQDQTTNKLIRLLNYLQDEKVNLLDGIQSYTLVHGSCDQMCHLLIKSYGSRDKNINLECQK